MEIRLIKKHKLGRKELPVGTEAGVTNEIGQDLVNRGIAEDITKQYITRVIDRENDNAKAMEALIREAKQVVEEEDTKEKAKKLEEKINKKDDKKS